MNLLKAKSHKKEQRRHDSDEGILESFKGIGTGVVDSLTKNLVADGAHEAWNELLLADDKSSESHGKNHSSHDAHGGDLEAGQEFDLSSLSEKAHELTDFGRAAMNEVVHAGERAGARQSQEIEVRMHQIIIEIKKLTESSGELQQKVEVLTMEQTGESVGIYHVNFLDKMLNFIHELRMNVDDSLAWFSAINGKKQARQYKSMAKKHGTSFTLNNERQVATQVG